MSDVFDRQIRTDIEMIPVARDKEIHLLFNERDLETKELCPAFTSNFLMSADQGLTLAALLADLAFEADSGLKPAGSAIKTELADRHRTKLTNRISLMLNSMREKKTINNHSLSRQLVDVMLAEVLA